MYIEKLIEALVVSQIDIGMYNDRLLYSMYCQVDGGLALTEKQSKLCLRILKQYSTPLSDFLNRDITHDIENPTYLQPLRVASTVVKQLSIISDDAFVRSIKIVFPYNSEHITLLKRNAPDFGSLLWDQAHKYWKVPLTEKNILFLLEFARKYEFNVDVELQQFSVAISTVLEKMDQYTPMLVMNQGKPMLANVSQYVPELTSTDLVPAIFESRKLGIFAWDSQIAEQLIKQQNISPCIQEFLNSDPGAPFFINSKLNPLCSLGIIIKYLSPCLFILPGGSELEKLTAVHEMISRLGINNDEISVMFRLSSINGSDFNAYIRKHMLNGEINNNTKVVFISGKVPKPLIRSKIKFHSAINLGFDSAHYSMRRLVASQENLINFSEANLTRLFNFDDL